MPFYLCLGADDLSNARRRDVARAIAHAHCEVTGAPVEFVHVAFLDAALPSGEMRIVGNVRNERSEQLLRKLHNRVVLGVSNALGDRAEVRLNLNDVPAEWVMEGGHVLPSAGTEAEWMASHWRPPSSTKT